MFKTEAAQVANTIKKELKAKWPTVKFMVHSEVFAGGDSVDVGYVFENESSPREVEVSAVVKKYQAGYFDGMDDLYHYDENKTGPTVKFAFVNVNYQKFTESQIPAFLKYWGLEAFEDTLCMQKLGKWKDQALWQYVQKEILK